MYGFSALYLSIFLMALNGFFAKAIPLDAATMTGLRSMLAVLVLSAFILVRKRLITLNNTADYIGVYTIGILLGVHWITYFYAMQVSTVAIGMLSLFSFPIITVLLEPFFHKNKIKKADILSAIMVFIGLYIMVEEHLHNLKSNVVLGVAAGVLSALSFTLRSLLQKYKYAHVSSDALILHQTLSIALLGIFWLDWTQIKVMPLNGWLMLICLGVVSTAGAHTFLSYALKHLPAKTAAMISCLTPIVGAFIAWALLGEIPTQSVVFGGGIILGVAVFESVTHSKKKIKKRAA